jgi:translation initiation factor 2 gamma subunit (eIF-2gamma)
MPLPSGGPLTDRDSPGPLTRQFQGGYLGGSICRASVIVTSRIQVRP